MEIPRNNQLRITLASNAQSAIISNADTLREITKGVSGFKASERGIMFYKAVAGIALAHADALMEALNNPVQNK